MTHKKNVLLLLLFLVVASCKGSIAQEENNDLYGVWNAIDVYYKESNLAEYNDTKNFVRANRMQIDKSKKEIVIYDISNRLMRANFRIKDNTISIYNSSDSRFKGNYAIKLVNLNPQAKGTMKYELELMSDSVYIFAQKTIFNPFPQ